jgi:hypothetical protein
MVFRLAGEGEPLQKKTMGCRAKRGRNAKELYLEKTSIRGVERGK